MVQNGLIECLNQHRSMVVAMKQEDIAHIASLIGDKARATMLMALLAGRALTAGELAKQANISPQTASSHLNKLVKSSLLVVESQGRHRYYRLANRDVAHVLESLALVAPMQPYSEKPVSEIQYARSCYDHLAGRLGVAVTLALLKNKWIKPADNEYVVTPGGIKFFISLGIDCEDLLIKRRRFAYPCLDWSERVHHLAGSLGARLLEIFIDKRWVMRVKSSRALLVTEKGKHELRRALRAVMPV